MTDVTDGFDFVNDGRTFSCRVEALGTASRENWWWFHVSGDDRHRYAPFRAAAGDTRAAVESRIVAYYDELQTRRATPLASHWHRNRPGKPGAPPAK
jgi:hypothetical protein